MALVYKYVEISIWIHSNCKRQRVTSDNALFMHKRMSTGEDLWASQVGMYLMFYPMMNKRSGAAKTKTTQDVIDLW